eukprot:GGOE01004108.1.p5 GENE.GGOE01004108.1~~GGOE01004108.1.p5  ORF type:complete len:116 (-),score=38.35 GGOE01004108.1:960-1307(-)
MSMSIFFRRRITHMDMSFYDVDFAPGISRWTSATLGKAKEKLHHATGRGDRLRKRRSAEARPQPPPSPSAGRRIAPSSAANELFADLEYDASFSSSFTESSSFSSSPTPSLQAKF